MIVVISLRAPPQSGQIRTSTANTRRKSSAQRSLRVLAGLERPTGGAVEPDVAGRLEVSGRLEVAGEPDSAGRIEVAVWPDHAGRPEVAALGSVEP